MKSRSSLSGTFNVDRARDDDDLLHSFVMLLYILVNTDLVLYTHFFRRMLVPGKMQHVICTGNIGAKEQYDEIRELAPNVHCVAGDYDDAQAFPEHKVISVGDFRIGIIHGHQVIPWGNQDALARMRRKLHCDVLISGHTHANEIIEYDKHYHINPVRMNDNVKCGSLLNLVVFVTYK